ncbi:MAG: ATP-binding protein [Cyclobacteriaceae bacterium]
MAQKKNLLLGGNGGINWSAELTLANKQIAIQNTEKDKRAAAMVIANAELSFQQKEKRERAAELVVANKELKFQKKEKAKRAAELVLAIIELEFQKREKVKRAAELVVVNKELVYQTEEKGKRATELIIANVELTIEIENKEKRAAELIIANKELIYQNEEKEKLAARLVIANNELAFQNEEKEKRASELMVANGELAFQNREKEVRAWELMIANKELAFQNEEKEKRATELLLANRELLFQNTEKEKRAAELITANTELAFQNEEKGKRATELVIVNAELAFQNVEKEKRAAELIIANRELVFQNIEKEKRALELLFANDELIKAEEQFRLVVESAPNAMVLINAEGVITLINTETERLFDYQRRELVGSKLEILIPERFRNYDAGNSEMFFWKPQSVTSWAGPDRLAVRKDGTEIRVEIRLNLIQMKKGQMILASIVDISEKIQKAILKEQNLELAQIVCLASHDLQEPLRTVSNYMAAFEEAYGNTLDENAGKYIGSVKSAVKRMGLLIKSLLDFSYLGHNIKLTLVDCKQVIWEVIADLDVMIKTSNATVGVNEMPSIYLYEVQIRQVFQNLITNAIKFHKPGIAPEIQICAQQLSDKWKFSIIDKGIGIDPLHFDKVFEIFQRLHSKQDYEGTGIGLANCKKIVQMHLGEIWVESTEGDGSTFHFTVANLKP